MLYFCNAGRPEPLGGPSVRPGGRTLEPRATLEGRIMEFSSVRELLFSQVREKTNILAEPRITFLRRKLLLEKSTKTRITLRNVILGGFVREL